MKTLKTLQLYALVFALAGMSFAQTVGGKITAGGKVNAQTGTTYTVKGGDCGNLVTLNNAGAITVTIPVATSMPPICVVGFQDLGAGTATLTPTTSTINGNATQALNTGQGIEVWSDGTNYQIIAGIGGGGITNAAGNNVITKSNGTNLIASSITDNGTMLTSTDLLLSLTEGACSGAAAGTDVLCADATLHAFKSALNNGSFVAIPQLAGDLGGTAASPTVTSTHITGGSSNLIAKFSSGNLVNSSITDNGTTVSTAEAISTNSSLTSGSSGNAGQIILVGSTSGSSSITAPAVAGTNTNQLAISNVINIPRGTLSAAAITFGTDTNQGIYSPAGGTTCLTSGGASLFCAGSNQAQVIGSQGLRFEVNSNAFMVDTTTTGLVTLGKTAGTSTGSFKVSGYQSGGTTFTTNAGCSETSLTGGASVGSVASGTTGTCTFIVTMGDTDTAAHGWKCTADDETTPADLIHQSGHSTKTATLTGTTVSGDVISFACFGY